MTVFQKTVTLLFFIVILNAEMFATGPSYLRAEIKPISVNEKGEILCRTRFLKNPTGGSYPADIEYGVCVLANDTIIQFSTNVLSFFGYPSIEGYEQHLAYWDSIFDSGFDLKQLSDIEHGVQYNYKFKESNISHFKRNDTITFSKFERDKKVKLQKTPQMSLYGANGYCVEKDIINVLYDFGNIVLINNKNQSECEGEEYDLGAIFDYPNLLGNEDIGYDCQTVTGVLFLK